MFRSIRPYALEAGVDDPVVCYQGAVVAEPESGRWLRHVPIPLQLAREAIGAVRDEGFGLNCYVDDELYVAEVTDVARRYAEFQHLDLHSVGNLLAWLDRPPTKLVVIDEPEVLDGLEKRLKARFDGRLYISKSLPYFLELASPKVTKASGLDFLAPRIGFSRARTVATARTTSSCSSGPATASRSRTRTSACSRRRTSSARAWTRKGWPRCSKRS